MTSSMKKVTSDYEAQLKAKDEKILVVLKEKNAISKLIDQQKNKAIIAEIELKECSAVSAEAIRRQGTAGMLVSSEPQITALKEKILEIQHKISELTSHSSLLLSTNTLKQRSADLETLIISKTEQIADIQNEIEQTNKMLKELRRRLERQASRPAGHFRNSLEFVHEEKQELEVQLEKMTRELFEAKVSWAEKNNTLRLSLEHLIEGMAKTEKNYIALQKEHETLKVKYTKCIKKLQKFETRSSHKKG
eukprot:TRINITY_DN17409_c0_g1_i2.p1 TRINITY_DN17409_c0_g1~~TRINITY_DN17409_c0_g1_i2.p1  ORF type:complete len:256 (-),score=61.13 TRINITY_DN17409_c0_g1_i2:36-782(-)